MMGKMFNYLVGDIEYFSDFSEKIHDEDCHLAFHAIGKRKIIHVDLLLH